MNISQDEVQEKLNKSVEIYLAQKAKDDARLNLFYGSAEKDNEPDYEILRKHIEIWTQRHPQEMRDFLEFKKEQLKNNYKDNGASHSLETRNLGAMPPGLYGLLCTLSPNFLGANEFTAENKSKRSREFYKRFPVFRMCEKL